MRFMWSARTVSCLAVTAFSLLGCVGGQSGTEGEPSLDPCQKTMTSAVALDEVTPAGTAQELFESLTAPQTASLRWFSHDGSGVHGDTTLTVSVVGEPGVASYVVPVDENTSCSARLEVEGVLRFTTEDGAFDESFMGVAHRDPSGQSGFRGRLAVSAFAGTYDTDTVAAHYRDPELMLNTSMSPASGNMFMSGDSSTPGASPVSAAIAEW
jgi:hypothetical protein